MYVGWEVVDSSRRIYDRYETWQDYCAFVSFVKKTLNFYSEHGSRYLFRMVLSTNRVIVKEIATIPQRVRLGTKSLHAEYQLTNNAYI